MTSVSHQYKSESITLANELIDTKKPIVEYLAKSWPTVAVSSSEDDSFTIHGLKDNVTDFNNFLNQFLNDIKYLSKSIRFEPLGNIAHLMVYRSTRKEEYFRKNPSTYGRWL